jgi:hypothetical protein
MDSAFGDRTAPYVINIVGRWDDPELDAPMPDWSTGVLRGLGGAVSGRAYVNFSGDAGVDPVAILARLRALKDRYDPTNAFHLNRNIRPTTA